MLNDYFDHVKGADLLDQRKRHSILNQGVLPAHLVLMGSGIVFNSRNHCNPL
ncbi:MAG: hypothetical protein R2827_12100 [Bdellovibrionales bacterium]